MAKNKMTTCSACGHEIATGKKVVCPNCGKVNKKPIYQRTWFIVVVALILLSGIGGALGGGDSSSESASSNNSSNSGSIVSQVEDLTIEGDITQTQDDYFLYFEGIIKNNTDKEITYASITISLYDKDGNLLGTALDNINNLKAGGTWKFKATSLLTSEEVSQVTDWEVSELTGF